MKKLLLLSIGLLLFNCSSGDEDICDDNCTTTLRVTETVNSVGVINWRVKAVRECSEEWFYYRVYSNPPAVGEVVCKDSYAIL